MRFNSLLATALLVPGIALVGCQNPQSGDDAGSMANSASKPAGKSASMASSGGSGAIKPNTQVATINGEPVIWADLASDEDFSKMLMKFETEQAQRRFQLQNAGLSRLVEERLVEMEAKAQGMTTEAYLQKEVSAKVQDASDEELEQLFNRFRRRMRGTFEDNKAQLAERHRQQEEARVRQELVTSLREKYSVETNLPYPELPRLPVTVDDDPFKGGKDADVAIVVFSEFQCPYCSRAVPTIDQLSETYGDKIKIVFRDFPLEFHQNAAKAAEAGECADEQGKFWEMHDKLFANQRALGVDEIKGYASELGLDTAKFNECLDSGKFAEEVAKDVEDGRALGVTGTPTFFINGQMIAGALPYETLKAIVDSELSR